MNIINEICCADCANFTDEDITGIGYCELSEELCNCDEFCRYYLPKDEDYGKRD